MPMCIRLLVFFLLLTVAGFSQSICLSGGLSKNKLFTDGSYDFRKSEVKLKGEEGWALTLNIRPTTSKQSLSIILDHYHGQVIPQNKYNAEVPDILCIEKTTLGLGLYPWDIRLFGDFYIQPGGDISVLISDKTKLGINEPNGLDGYIMTYRDDSLKIANDFQYGVSVVARYQFDIGNFFIAPSYKFYLGARSEFGKNTDLVYDRTGSIFVMRHTFSLGIGIKLVKRKNEDFN